MRVNDVRIELGDERACSRPDAMNGPQEIEGHPRRPFRRGRRCAYEFETVDDLRIIALRSLLGARQLSRRPSQLSLVKNDIEAPDRIAAMNWQRVIEYMKYAHFG